MAVLRGPRRSRAGWENVQSLFDSMDQRLKGATPPGLTAGRIHRPSSVISAARAFLGADSALAGLMACFGALDEFPAHPRFPLLLMHELVRWKPTVRLGAQVLFTPTTGSAIAARHFFR